jgi:nickel superoxide dismutase
MRKRVLSTVLAVSLVLTGTGIALAHCEIPCGIYDDQMRVHLIAEHITTVEKSMRRIVELSGQKSINHNQLVRWITNKEQHADKIQHIVTQYFMTQRIKSATKDYEKKLVVLHKMLVHAMECKQTTDLAHVGELRSLLEEFEKLYFGDSHR